MKFSDYCIMLSNIDPDSILCRVIRVRSEKDSKTIAEFSDWEREIYIDWNNYRNSKLCSTFSNKTRKEQMDEMFRAYL